MVLAENEIKEASIEETKDLKIVETKKERSKYWDIVKGIGILSIVIGHAKLVGLLHDFVYTFHLAIFYFVSIYFYNEDKYGDKPFEYFCNKLKNNWTKYMFWSIILILFHNFFLKYNFYGNMEYYTGVSSYIVRIVHSMFFNNGELFAGALWFVFTLIFASGLFAGIIYLSRKIAYRVETSKKVQDIIKYICIVIFAAFIGIIGVHLNNNKLELQYHVHTSFLIMPICVLAYFFRKLTNKIKLENKWYISLAVAIVSAAFIYFAILKNGMAIELSKEMIINGYMFYIVSTIGIIFCLSLSAFIEKIPIVNSIFSILGQHSFTIMALHFACIKGVDVIYAHIINETNPEVISQWVNTYPEKLLVVYIIVGIVVPVLISLILDFIKDKIKLVTKRA